MSSESNVLMQNLSKQLSVEEGNAVGVGLSKQAEARLAARRIARSESKVQHEANEVQTNINFSDDVEVLQAELLSLREKYQQAMLTNVQQDSCKQTLRYHVDNLKEQFDEMETSQKQLRSEQQKLLKESELEKKQLKKLELEAISLRESLAIHNKIIEEYDLKPNGVGDKITTKSPCVSLATAQVISQLPANGDERQEWLSEEIERLELEVRRLQIQITDEREQTQFVENLKEERSSRSLANSLQAEKDINLQLTDTRLKLKKAEQDLMSLEGNAARLESQAKRFQTDAERAEKSEEGLRTERDRLQKELSEVTGQLTELKSQNEQMQKSLDNWKLAKQNSILNKS